MIHAGASPRSPLGWHRPDGLFDGAALLKQARFAEQAGLRKPRLIVPNCSVMPALPAVRLVAHKIGVDLLHRRSRCASPPPRLCA